MCLCKFQARPGYIVRPCLKKRGGVGWRQGTVNVMSHVELNKADEKALGYRKDYI